MERLDLNSTVYSPSELAIHAVRYLPLRDVVRGMRVLDIACGEGLGATLMVEQFGARQVVGVDISREAIAKAKAANTRDALVFVLSDAVEFLKRSALGRFDVVTCVETIEHLPDPEAFLALVKRAVRDAGLIYISCPNDHWYYGGGRSANTFHVQKYTADEFFAAAQPHLGEPEHRYLGSVLTGFASYPMPLATANDYRSAARPAAGSAFSLIAPAASSAKAEAELRSDNSLFYAGLWNFSDKPVVARAGLVGWPAGASYRQPAITSLPRAMQQHGAATRMTIAHGPSATSVAAAESIAHALDGRLTVHLQVVDPADPATIAALLRAPPSHFLHFADLTTADAIYNGVAGARPDGIEPETLAWTLARAVWSFGALAGDANDTAFWQYPAYLFDGYMVDQAHPRAASPLVHKARPEVMAEDEQDPIQKWLRLLRRAEQAADGGGHSLRYAELLRLLRARKPKPKPRSSAKSAAAAPTQPSTTTTSKGRLSKAS